MLIVLIAMTAAAILTGTIYSYGQLHRDDKLLYVEGLTDDMSR